MAEDNTTYQVRLPKTLLADFLELARKNDKSPAGELREFMREYVSREKTKHAAASMRIDDIPF